MSTKLLIAAILLAGLSGLIYWSNKHQAAEDAKPAKDTPPKLVTIPDSDVKRIEVQKKGAEPITIEKNAGGTQWTMQTPKQWPVDRDAAASMSSAFTGLTWDRLVEDKAGDLAQYGLADPQLKVTATGKNNKSQTLLLGDDTPAGGGVFAKLENDPRVFTIQSGTKSNFDKTPQDLRDKRLLTFAQEKLSRIDVTEKGQTFEFGRNSHGDWQIVQPKPYRADSFQVEELVRKLKDARMESTPDAKPPAFTGIPVATIKLTDDTGTQQIEIRKTGKDKEATYLAKSSVLEGVYKVSSDLGEQAAKGMQDYRNKKPFEFGFKDVGKIDMQDGSAVYSFQRSGKTGLPRANSSIPSESALFWTSSATLPQPASLKSP